MNGTKWNQNYDSTILQFFNIRNRCTKFNSIVECQWNAPDEGYVMFCCDGAAIGNPGNAGFGIIARDQFFQVLGTISGGIGIATNYIAEVLAVVCAIEWAVRLCCYKIVICSDSKSVVEDFKRGKIPWFIHARWVKACQSLTEITYIHCYREINFSADAPAKKGARLNLGEVIHDEGRPAFLVQIEIPDRKYYRFC
ncbi:uncharacterized protein LOC113315834 [Papaver somniferum]|uniref:uncharacterized protein LOC113315834 n=1 Tax=Papaver somniferum TaxID=3469 RepID=UPI000E701772|nr:uncharacterized protein LOC113315834 [Papaver somniferum]